MKTIIFILILFFIVVSCKKKKEVNERELRIFVEQSIKKTSDSTAKLTEFNFIKLDTVTSRMKMFMYEYDLKHEFDLSLEHTDLQIDKLHLCKSDYLFAKSFGLNSIESRKYNYDKQKEIAIKFYTNDSLLNEDLFGLRKQALLADNTKAINYLAKCAYSIKRIDNSVKTDTMFVYLDTLFNIISNSDFNASLLKLYPRKSKPFYEL